MKPATKTNQMIIFLLGHVGSLDLNSANKYYFKVQKPDLYQKFVYELLIILVLSYNQTDYSGYEYLLLS